MKEIDLNNAQDSNDVLEVIFEKNYKTQCFIFYYKYLPNFFQMYLFIIKLIYHKRECAMDMR